MAEADSARSGIGPIDAAAYGFDRAVDHAYWQTAAHLTTWTRGGQTVAYSYVWPGGRIGPVAGLDPASAAAALEGELARATGAVTVHIPGSSRALVAVALRRGLRISPTPGLLLLSDGVEPPDSLAIGSYSLYWNGSVRCRRSGLWRPVGEQQAGDRPREPPVPAPSSCISDGTSSARMTVASKMTPAESPMPNCLMSVPGPVESTKNARQSTSAALVTSFPVRAIPSAIAWRRVTRLVVGLANTGQHEDLVVHRQAVEEREDHQRDPGNDRVGRRHAPDRLRAVAPLEDEDDDAVGGSERHEIENHRLQRQDHRPESSREQQEGQQDDEEEHVREVAVHRVHEVLILGGDATERHA